jgi:hypothetical protein
MSQSFLYEGVEIKVISSYVTLSTHVDDKANEMKENACREMKMSNIRESKNSLLAHNSIEMRKMIELMIVLARG